MRFGCDTTTGIVSVDADASGQARVWRRVGERIEVTAHEFPTWFLTTGLDLLAHLPARRLDAGWLRAAHGRVTTADFLTVVELEDSRHSGNADAYRYLVLTSNLAEVETALVETANKREGAEAQSLADLRGLVLIWHPIEQFLTLTGRTYFKGMRFEDLRRMQFDLETTGLSEDRDRIFMVSMRDSSGWQECLEIGSLSEAQVIERFVQTVRSRDPDILENHNIFGFDLSFLVKRAGRLGVRLALGRDGSEPRLETDVFDAGERPEPFLRWRVAGREVIDTQHAVRRFGIGAPDMRRHGLKDAARYFGLARRDREYVAGAEVWPTYRTDPQRIRRYAADDVEEVDSLSRRLLPSTFELASMLPRAYERIAANSGPTSLWELLMVRAYLHAGRAIAAPTPRISRTSASSRSELFVKGVIGKAVRVEVQTLLPRVIADRSIAAPNDDLGVMPVLVGGLLEERPGSGAQLLAAAAQPYLGGQGLFSDPQAASEALWASRKYIDGFLAEARRQGATVVEVDGEHVVLGVPAEWQPSIEQQVADVAREYLPAGVELTYPAHYDAYYTRAPGTAMTVGADGAVTLVGSPFRAGRLERFGEAFMRRAAPLALLGDIPGLRELFVETVRQLRAGQVSLDDLCVQVTLHKSLAHYRRGGTHEEPYEVLLAAGIRSWRIGQRIRYFRARSGEPRLLREGDAVGNGEADTEYYVQRLCGLYCQQFAQAFRREDFARIFHLPPADGALDPLDMNRAELADIRPIATPVG